MSQDPASLSGSRDQKLAEMRHTVPIIPVITIDRLEDAVPLAHALAMGGLRLLEITLRTSAAADADAAIIQEVPEAIVVI